MMSERKEFIWYSLRVGFLVMIFCWLLNILLVAYNVSVGLVFFLFLFVWLTSAIFVFIVSIIHLVKHKKKALPIIALILSSFLILTFFIGLWIGFGSVVGEDVEEGAKIWNIALNLIGEGKTHSSKAQEFVDSCNNNFDIGDSNYGKGDYSTATYDYSECQKQCHNAVSEYGQAKALFEEAGTKLGEKGITTSFTENINRLINYWVETSGSAINIYSNKFEACEYMETAMIKYSQEDYGSGDWAINNANTKISQHDYWVGIHNEYLAKSEALQKKIDLEIKYSGQEQY